jgi:hypothetical protein
MGLRVFPRETTNASPELAPLGERSGEGESCLPPRTQRDLRALERDDLVDRTICAEAPVRVEYSLTALGWTMTGPRSPSVTGFLPRGGGERSAQEGRVNDQFREEK